MGRLFVLTKINPKIASVIWGQRSNLNTSQPFQRVFACPKIERNCFIFLNNRNTESIETESHWVILLFLQVCLSGSKFRRIWAWIVPAMVFHLQGALYKHLGFVLFVMRITHQCISGMTTVQWSMGAIIIMWVFWGRVYCSLSEVNRGSRVESRWRKSSL